MRVCIVGAGAAGLASARQAIDERYKYSCVVFEQTGEIGGTWVYDDRTGVDEYGIPIHTSMYRNLRTNLPKEVMGYPDFPIPDYEESYITQEQILKFLNDYADNYNLRSLIQFHHRVKSIEPQGSQWKVTVSDVKNKVDETHEFDAVLVCNGHYHTPRLADLPGADVFRGQQVHSHDFRDVHAYQDKRVVVIGAGPSGMDIALQITTTAKEVYLSHHCREEIRTVFPENFVQKPDVHHLTCNEVVFNDNSRVEADVIMYCTGYLYSFPFLSDKCGVSVEDNHVTPLYKHLVNINNPTMCFVGLPFYVCAFSMFDLQVRFFFEHLKGTFKLPSKEEMLSDLDAEMQQLYAEGFSKKHAHMMGPKQDKYYEALASIACLKPLPPFMARLHTECSKQFSDDLLNFRSYVFKVVDDSNYVRIK